MSEEKGKSIFKAINWVKWFVKKEPKEIKTEEGNVYKVEGLMGLHLFPDGTLFFLTASDDNTITLIPTEIVDVPLPTDEDFNEESETFLKGRIKNIVDFYLEGEGKELGKEGMVHALENMMENIINGISK